MQFSNPDFSATVRTLTSFGAGALSTVTLQNQSIAASATVSISPVAGRLRIISVGLKAGAAGTLVLQATDGTNAYPIATAASGTLVGVADHACNNGNASQIKNNDGTNAGAWSIGGADLIT